MVLVEFKQLIFVVFVDNVQAEAMVVDSGVAGVREEEVEAEEEEVEEVSGIEEVP